MSRATLGPVAIALASAVALAGCAAPAAPASPQNAEADAALIPHVLVGLADSGINPYHALFYRPHLTEHPCTYIRDFPCDVEELRLTVGGDDWEAAVEADRDAWEAVQPGTWYWIPQTSFVAVACAPDDTPPCLLDEATSHGSYTTSVVAQQAPDALLAFVTGASIAPFAEGGILVDVHSVSIGGTRPLPRGTPLDAELRCRHERAPLLFRSASNDPLPSFVDCDGGAPTVVAVGGGYTDPRAGEAMARAPADVASFYCPPVAMARTTSGMHDSGDACGTSFATPYAAGSLARVLLELRRGSGYDGGVNADGVVDRALGITASDVRAAINATASWEPAPRHAPGSKLFIEKPYWPGPAPVALNPVAPWLQWGWGFYDEDAANATRDLLLGLAAAPVKPDAAREHMRLVADLRERLYGGTP